MSIETTKIDLVQRLLTVDDEEILHRIEALLDSNFAVNPDLQNSIKEGLDDMKEGKVHPHSEARKLYEKWLRD